MTKQIIGDELYVYWHGKLIYKRWLSQRRGVIIDSYGLPWQPQWRDGK